MSSRLFPPSSRYRIAKYGLCNTRALVIKQHGLLYLSKHTVWALQRRRDIYSEHDKRYSSFQPDTADIWGRNEECTARVHGRNKPQESTAIAERTGKSDSRAGETRALKPFLDDAALLKILSKLRLKLGRFGAASVFKFVDRYQFAHPYDPSNERPDCIIMEVGLIKLLVYEGKIGNGLLKNFGYIWYYNALGTC